VNGGIEGGGPVDPDALAGPRRFRRHDVDVAFVRRPDTPHGRGAVMAQHAARGQHRRHLAAEGRRDRTNLIDAAVDPPEPPGRDAMRHGVPRQSRRCELRSRHNPALTGGERGDRPVASKYFVENSQAARAIATFVPYGQRFVALGGHR
jgi:hypothetical protein